METYDNVLKKNGMENAPIILVNYDDELKKKME